MKINNIAKFCLVLSLNLGWILPVNCMEIMATDRNYVISNIIVRGKAETQSGAVETSFRQAKYEAVQAIKSYSKINDLFLDEYQIDIIMTAFSPVKSSFDGENYAAIYDIIIDKAMLKSVIFDNHYKHQPTYLNNKSIFAIVKITNPYQWSKVRERLDASGLHYQVISLTGEEIELVFKLENEQNIVKILSGARLIYIKNRNLNFIKLA